MQRFTPVAVVLGALIVAAALVFHGYQLAEVARRLEDLEHRTGGLDERLNKFSEELPVIVGQAGREAGRQAVHGVIDEVVQKPLQKITGRRTAHTGNGNNATEAPDSKEHAEGLFTEGGVPFVRFDIREPVVNVEVLGNLQELTSLLPSSSKDRGDTADVEVEEQEKEQQQQGESRRPKKTTQGFTR